jgi:hypothetical protein
MASRSERTDGWPTVLWIAWRVGEVEHEEPLCLVHRAYVFEHYADVLVLTRINYTLVI